MFFIYHISFCRDVLITQSYKRSINIDSLKIYNEKYGAKTKKYGSPIVYPNGKDD